MEFQVMEFTDHEFEDTSESMSIRRKGVMEMINYAFKGYEKYTTTRVLYKESSMGWFGKDPVLNMLTSMSTLWMIGKKDEFYRCEEYVQQHLNFDKMEGPVMLYYVVTDFIGSMLAVYTFTKNIWWLNKARETADRLAPAYDTPNGLPWWKIVFAQRTFEGEIISLSDAYVGALEYAYLSELTGDPQYRARIDRIRALAKIDPKTGKLRTNYVSRYNIKLKDIATEKVFWGTQHQLFRDTREFYYTLVKEWYASRGADKEALDIYKVAMDPLIDSKTTEVVKQSIQSDMLFIQAWDPHSKKDENIMEYEGAYVGAMWSQAAHAMQFVADPEDAPRIKEHWRLAMEITRTVRTAHTSTHTMLAPRKFLFTESVLAKHRYWEPYDSQYHLSFEMAETYLWLWRLTGNFQHRRDAWNLAKAIHDCCKTISGYSSINSIDEKPTVKLQMQPVHFISATLKYLYLIFCDGSHAYEWGAQRWVFNAHGQPLPIKGMNTLYPEEVPVKGVASVFVPGPPLAPKKLPGT